MIVPMKKIRVILQSKDAVSAVKILRSLGVVHIEHQHDPSGEEIRVLKDDLILINSALDILNEASREGICPQNGNVLQDWEFTCKHIIDSYKRLQQLREYSYSLSAAVSEWEPWGDFDPAMIRQLQDKGVHIQLYRVPAKEVKKFPSDVIVKKIRVAAGMMYCAVVSRKRILSDLPEVALPKTGLTSMRQRLSEDTRIMRSLKDEISRQVCFRRELFSKRDSLQKKLEFYEALGGMGKEGMIVYLSGYIPYDHVDPLEEAGQKEKWAYVIEEPSEEDRVPTLIRNPRWVSLIKPVFKIIEIVPGYRELDISVWFLIFFSVFFGILIGDAGYGLVFFIITFFSQRKWADKVADKSFFKLFYLLSFCAIVWGVLSGTFFGQAWLPQYLRPVIPALRDDKEVQTLCFFIGALHLSIAHCWRAIIKLPSIAFLAELGWIFILWGVFYLARFLILSEALPEFGRLFLLLGAILVVFFTDPRKNVFKSIGAGLGNFMMNAINNFTDVVSYIRLFAVGLATVAVADAFNTMAMDVGFNNPASGILTAVILFTGHMLNILLGPMSILVHGVRLNVLEFCSHLDIKWSGVAYRPLQE